MLNCKDVTHLLSESQDRKLKLAERLRLQIHLSVCEGCTRYRLQIDFIRRACRTFIDGSSSTEE
ncbi:MAG TPA: zf-HC2 domain-containing protein [Rhodocyclaceae bacterium]|nr:zf-HC2 domain-containing protein [Rhodocyclaceae bacterium]